MTVVVGYTPTKYGDAALTYAIAEAELRGLRLVVVNATKGDALVDDKFAKASAIEALDTELAKLGVEHEVRQSMGADIAEQILTVVNEVDASLLVIGMRHRTPVGKLLLGSTAQRLLLDAPCAILAVKPEN